MRAGLDTSISYDPLLSGLPDLSPRLWVSRGGQWSGWQAPQGVQPAPVAALSDICCTSSSSMKRMRMQLSVWYRGTPGTTVT